MKERGKGEKGRLGRKRRKGKEGMKEEGGKEGEKRHKGEERRERGRIDSEKLPTFFSSPADGHLETSGNFYTRSGSCSGVFGQGRAR